MGKTNWLWDALLINYIYESPSLKCRWSIFYNDWEWVFTLNEYHIP